MKYLWLGHNGVEITVDMENNREKHFTRECKTKETNRQPHSPTRKIKRYRSAFTTDQVNYLEKEFKKFPYIGNGQRKEIAIALNISERAVKIWFQNRRMKEKKDTSIKEFDDDPNSNRAVEFGKDPLNNGRTVQSINDQTSYSLPVLTSPVVTMNKPNIDYNVNTVNNKEYDPKNMEANYYKEAFCNQKQTIPSHTSIHPCIKNRSSSDYKTSAEFSIDLCKKYQGQSKVVNFDKQTKQRHNNLSRKPSLTYNQGLPRDFTSCKKPKLSQAQHKISQGNANLNNPRYIPIMPTIYAQPYLSSGGVLWKPININPVMAPSGPSPLTISSNPPKVQEDKKSCNCNCHEKPHPTPMTFHQNLHSPHPQYVITALPFQNASSKV